MEAQTVTKENRNNKKPNTTNDQRTAILVFLSQRHKDGRLCHGATQEAMVNFGVSGETIRRIWRLGREGVMDPTKSLDVSSKKKGKCGRKRKWGKEKLEEVRSITLCDRQTLDRFAFCIGVPKTSMWRLLQDRQLKRHSSALKNEQREHITVPFAWALFMPFVVQLLVTKDTVQKLNAIDVSRRKITLYSCYVMNQ